MHGPKPLNKTWIPCTYSVYLRKMEKIRKDNSSTVYKLGSKKKSEKNESPSHNVMSFMFRLLVDIDSSRK
jgi:hypothetical protein